MEWKLRPRKDWLTDVLLLTIWFALVLPDIIVETGKYTGIACSLFLIHIIAGNIHSYYINLLFKNLEEVVYVQD